MKQSVGEMKQLVGEMKQFVGEMKQIWWGNEAKWWANEAKSDGEMPHRQSEITPPYGKSEKFCLNIMMFLTFLITEHRNGDKSQSYTQKYSL